jgi:hypothetical protein
MHHAATSIVATSTRLLSATIKDAKARPNAPDAIIKSKCSCNSEPQYFLPSVRVLNQLKIPGRQRRRWELGIPGLRPWSGGGAAPGVGPLQFKGIQIKKK